MSQTKKGFYHGWWIVIASFFLMAIIFSSMLTLPGVFTVAVTEELGVSRTSFTLHMTICLLASTVAAFFVGKAFTKCNPKTLMTIVTIIAGLCFVGYSFATNVYHFYIASAVVGFSGMFTTSVPIGILITNWFGPKMKGKAMGIAMTGSGVGAMALNPILSAIILQYSWQMAYRLLAVLTFVLCLPLVLFAVSRAPADRGLERLGDDPNAVATPGGAVSGLTTAQGLKSSLFWVMFLTFCLFGITTSIFNNNAIPNMTDCGLAAVTASTVMSISSLGVIIGKILLGVINDKANARAASSFAIICLIAGLAVFLMLPKMTTFLVAALGAFVFGVGNANATVCMPLITSDLMGNRDFGTLFSYASISSTIGAAVGPVVGSLVFDATGSYSGAWMSDIVLMICMLLLLFLCYKMKSGIYRKLGV